MGIFDSLVAQASQPQGAIYWIDKVARTSLSKIVIFAIVLTAVRLLLYPTIKNTPAHMRTGSYTFARWVNEICDALVYAAVVVFMLVRPFGIQTFHIPTGSMLETLHERDFIIANKLVYRYSDPKVGDIVVFHPPKEAFHGGQEETDYIKRLVGAPGDVVEYKNLVLFRNGKPVTEPYMFFHTGGIYASSPFVALPKSEWPTLVNEVMDFKLIEVDGRTVPLLYKGDMVQNQVSAFLPPLPNDWTSKPATKIPTGYYLFMGDHRNGSFDGRFWGLVPRKNIIGRSEVVMLPFTHAGKTR